MQLKNATPRFFEKLTAARRGIIKFLCANEIIREAVEMNGQESHTCRVAAFVSIDRNAFIIRRGSVVKESHGASPCRGERKWRKKSAGGWTGGRSPLTSRQSGAAEVSMTPVRRRSADAARRDATRPMRLTASRTISQARKSLL